MATAEVRSYADAAAELEEAGWAAWLAGVLPQHCAFPFAEHHVDFWEWAWAIERGRSAPPFVAAWARGAAKSTSAEAAVSMWGCRGRRRYVLYVSGTQDKADDHVANVAAMLESPRVAALYPQASSRAVNKYGSSKGWRRNRLRTSSGFTVDALGLDTMARGAKVDEQRPDVIILDDVDDALDTAKTTDRKISLITKGILPAGSYDVVVLGVQNVIIDSGVFARLAGVSTEPCDFLVDRIVSGPVPAVRDLVTVQREDERGRMRTVIVGGTATWAGMDLVDCQQMIDQEGISAFRSERQHDTRPPSGGMFDGVDWNRVEVLPREVPELVRSVVWVDPAVTDKEDSDSQGISAWGHGVDDRGYLLWAWEQRTTPLAAICMAIRKALDLDAQVVGIETDQGGETWGSVFREAQLAVSSGKDGGERRPLAMKLTWDHAKAGVTQVPKAARAQRVLLAHGYEADRIRHVIGATYVARLALDRFPKTPPLDLVDSMVWGFRDLFPDAGRLTSESWTDRRGRR